MNTDLSARYGARYKAILVNDEEEEEEEEGNVGQERDLPIGRADVYLPGTSEEEAEEELKNLKHDITASAQLKPFEGGEGSVLGVGT